MADADTRSLQQIKRETEQTRAGLSNTVEQLKSSVAETASDIRHRISPDAIKCRGYRDLSDTPDALAYVLCGGPHTICGQAFRFRPPGSFIENFSNCVLHDRSEKRYRSSPFSGPGDQG
jgi:hypothetical protein